MSTFKKIMIAVAIFFVLYVVAMALGFITHIIWKLLPIFLIGGGIVWAFRTIKSKYEE